MIKTIAWVPLFTLFGVQDGDTALMMASARGHIDVVKLLLDKGAKINKRNRVGHFSRSSKMMRFNISMCPFELLISRMGKLLCIGPN